MKIVEYNILSSDTLSTSSADKYPNEGIINKTNIAIAKGWQPLGGIATRTADRSQDSPRFYQTIVKYEQ